MSKKNKNSEFGWGSLIRLAIFGLIVFFLINFFSGNQTNILGASVDTSFLSNIPSIVYNNLPEESKKNIQNWDKSPAIKYLQDQADGFPQRQIRELQKWFIKSVAEEMIKNIDKK